MAIFEYKSIKIAYDHTHPLGAYQNASVNMPPTIVFLHGWGTNKETFAEIIKSVKTTHPTYAIDFPGFGASDEPDSPWDVDAYTEMVIAFFEAMAIEAPIVLGHSFGGRVAIKMANRISLRQLILTSAAGIKPKRKASYYFKVNGFKLIRTLGKLPLLHFLLDEPIKAYSEKYSSADYKLASPMMKRILSKVVNEDLTPLLKNINVPTLLIWGDQDTATPIQDAHLMDRMIPDAGLVVFEGAGHFAYQEQPLRFCTILKTFIGD